MEKEHVVFSKKGVIQGLGRINLRNTSQWPQTTQPTTTEVGIQVMLEPGRHASLHPHHLDPSLRGDTHGSPNQALNGRLTGQDASFIEVATQAASATTSGVNMTSPITPPNHMEEERWYMLVATTLIRRLNLETTGVVLGDTATALPGGSAFPYPHMAAVLSGRVIRNQGITVKELDAK